MTDYKSIADRLVELGVVKKVSSHNYNWFGCTAEMVCHDWRVAGRCLETWDKWSLNRWLGRCETDEVKSPLAIILAYLEATNEK